MTKPSIAVAMMILYERGLMGLLDSVCKYFKVYSNQKVWTEDGLVQCKRLLSIYDLLNMTFGIICAGTDSEVGRQMVEFYWKNHSYSIL